MSELESVRVRDEVRPTSDVVLVHGIDFFFLLFGLLSVLIFFVRLTFCYCVCLKLLGRCFRRR